MKRVNLLLSILIGLILIPIGVLATEKPIVQSTEGFTLEQSVERTIKPTKDDKNTWKAKRKETKKYFKNKNLIKKSNYKRAKQIKEIEYLEKRLEEKQKQLETYNSNPEKGEKE